MDIEQLKLILDTVKGVSDGASYFAFFWLICDKLLPLIAWTIIGLYMIKKMPEAAMLLIDDGAVLDMRNQLKIGSIGYLSKEEKMETVKILQKLIDDHLEKTRGNKSAES